MSLHHLSEATVFMSRSTDTIAVVIAFLRALPVQEFSFPLWLNPLIKLATIFWCVIISCTTVLIAGRPLQKKVSFCDSFLNYTLGNSDTNFPWALTSSSGSSMSCTSSHSMQITHKFLRRKHWRAMWTCSQEGERIFPCCKLAFLDLRDLGFSIFDLQLRSHKMDAIGDHLHRRRAAAQRQSSSVAALLLKCRAIGKADRCSRAGLRSFVINCFQYPCCGSTCTCMLTYGG